MSNQAPAPRDLDTWFARVRALLRRHLLLNTPWLAGIADGPAGRALVAFIMDRPGIEYESREDIAALDSMLAGAAVELPAADLVIERFEHLRRDLPLADRDCDALWILLAPEFDLRFLAAYRLVWDDPSRRYCDEDFVLAMLSPHGPYRVRGLFEDGHSALLTLGLVDMITDSHGVVTLRPTRRLVDHMAGMQPERAMHGSPISLSRGDAVAVWDGLDFAGPLREALADGESGTTRPIVVIEGDRLANIDLGVAQYARHRQVSGAVDTHETCVVTLDLMNQLDEASDPSGPPQREAETIMRLVRQAVREAGLAGGFVQIRGGEQLARLDTQALRHVADLLHAARGFVFLECHPEAPPKLIVALTHDIPGKNRVVMIDLPSRSGREREFLWRYLHQRLGRTPDCDLPSLAEVPCDARTMEHAMRVHDLSRRPLVEVARSLVALNLPRFARRVEVKLGWHEIILPTETLHLIRQVRALAANHEQIMDTWGLSTRATGRGVKVLFSGPSGTGKTLAAGLLAKDARRELFQVDVAALLSKWVGETEKHLAQLFREARTSGSALLFDEADALFRQRSSTAEGGERFGAQIVNYLLEAIERFDGMVVLTTNLESAIDTAFARRLSYHIRFKPPDDEQRAALWRLHLPASLPLSDDVNIHRLGKRYDLTGGEIYKAAVRAAAVTVERGGHRVEVGDIETAVHSLYTEKGRLPPALAQPR